MTKGRDKMITIFNRKELFLTVVVKEVADYTDSIHYHSRICTQQEIMNSKGHGGKRLKCKNPLTAFGLIGKKAENYGKNAKYLGDYFRYSHVAISHS